MTEFKMVEINNRDMQKYLADIFQVFQKHNLEHYTAVGVLEVALKLMKDKLGLETVSVGEPFRRPVASSMVEEN